MCSCHNSNMIEGTEFNNTRFQFLKANPSLNSQIHTNKDSAENSWNDPSNCIIISRQNITNTWNWCRMANVHIHSQSFTQENNQQLFSKFMTWTRKAENMHHTNLILLTGRFKPREREWLSASHGEETGQGIIQVQIKLWHQRDHDRMRN